VPGNWQFVDFQTVSGHEPAPQAGDRQQIGSSAASRGLEVAEFAGKNSENSCCHSGGFALFVAESAPVLVRG
jgi:hypothetical protein